MAWKFRKSPQDEGYERVSLDRLAVGMEIWLDCPWYKHPFPKNRFTLISTEQINTIRALGLTDVYYHSASYRPDSLGHPAPSRDALDEPEVIPPAASVPPRRAQAPPCESVPASLQDLKHANMVYRDTLRKGSDCLRQITAGQRAGADNAGALVERFVDELLKSEAGGALADVLHLNVLERAQAAHALNTCILALLVGRELDLDAEELKIVGLAGLLHDVGEQRIPSQIRWKTEPLTRPEKSLYQLHPLYGREMLQELGGIPEEVCDIVEQHHEYLDGTGYPRRLTADQIHPLAKIVRVVDEYQNLTNGREFCAKLQPNQALAELYVKRPEQLSLKVMIGLVRAVSVYPPGTVVELTDGTIGIVLNTSSSERLRPIVMVYERNDSAFSTRLVDLNGQRQLSIRRIVLTSELPPDLARHFTPEETFALLLPTVGETANNIRQRSHR